MQVGDPIIGIEAGQLKGIKAVMASVAMPVIHLIIANAYKAVMFLNSGGQ
jgi:hypothetical protein